MLAIAELDFPLPRPFILSDDRAACSLETIRLTIDDFPFRNPPAK